MNEQNSYERFYAKYYSWYYSEHYPILQNAKKTTKYTHVVCFHKYINYALDTIVDNKTNNMPNNGANNSANSELRNARKFLRVLCSVFAENPGLFLEKYTNMTAIDKIFNYNYDSISNINVESQIKLGLVKILNSGLTDKTYRLNETDKTNSSWLTTEQKIDILGLVNLPDLINSQEFIILNKDFSGETSTHDLVCPISHRLMYDACNTSDGHCYSFASIVAWFNSSISNYGNVTSPLTNIKLTSKILQINTKIIRIIAKIMLYYGINISDVISKYIEELNEYNNITKKREAMNAETHRILMVAQPRVIDNYESINGMFRISHEERHILFYEWMDLYRRNHEDLEINTRDNTEFNNVTTFDFSSLYPSCADAIFSNFDNRLMSGECITFIAPTRDNRSNYTDLCNYIVYDIEKYIYRYELIVRIMTCMEYPIVVLCELLSLLNIPLMQNYTLIPPELFIEECTSELVTHGMTRKNILGLYLSILDISNSELTIIMRNDLFGEIIYRHERTKNEQKRRNNNKNNSAVVYDGYSIDVSDKKIKFRINKTRLESERHQYSDISIITTILQIIALNDVIKYITEMTS